MKSLLLSALVYFSLIGKMAAQGLEFQDSTFTAPLSLSDETEFISFQNCKFINIVGNALTLNKSGAVLSGCTFENIAGSAIVLDSCEVYLVNDTIRNVLQNGVFGTYSTVVVQSGVFAQISDAALAFSNCDLVEIEGCEIADVKAGIIFEGGQNDNQLSIRSSQIKRINISNLAIGTVSAIYATHVGLLEIKENTIDSCFAQGIWLEQSGIPSQIVLIQGNKISWTANSGILGLNFINAIIRDNHISYPGIWEANSPYSDGSCIFLIESKDTRIENNHLHHASSGSVLEYGSGIWLTSSATILRNHIHDCLGNGIFYSNLSSAGTEPLLLFNNIIHDTQESPIHYSGTGNNDFSEPSQTIIRNNTLHAEESLISFLDTPLAVFNNLNPVSAQGNILIYEGVADTNLHVLASPLGSFTESLNLKVPGDIHFVDYAGRDFHLASESSPAYNFLPPGFGLPNDDYDGLPRFGLHDAGADELVSLDTVCGCVNCPTDIPDLFFGDFTFSVGSADNNDLASPTQGVCGVRIQFEHEYMGDVTMELISPNAQTVQLIGPAGFWGATDLSIWNVGFTTCGAPASPDPGFSSVWSSNQPWGQGANYTGIYYPSGGCLEDYNSGSVTGDWTLRVFDNQVQDTGIVTNFEVIFCDISGLSCQPCTNPPVAAFASSVNSPWSVSLQNQSSGSISQLQFEFGDGESASGLSLPTAHVYADTGTYTLRLIAINDCGLDTFYQTVHIQGALPTVTATAQPMAGCLPLDVQTNVLTFDHVDVWHWIFPGGNPAESFEMEPLTNYSLSGEYPILLIVSNEVGSDTILVSNIAVLPILIDPSFSLQVLGDSIICTNTTQNASSFFWTINGGNPTGINTSPFVFEVSTSGLYSIGFSVSNICGTVELVDTVSVLISGGNSLESLGWSCSLSPNPNDGRFNVEINAPGSTPATLSVLNTLGEVIHAQSILTQEGKNLYPLDFEQLPTGLYHLHFQTAEGDAVLRFVKH